MTHVGVAQVFVALRDIRRGEELTWQYRAGARERGGGKEAEAWCLCGAPGCSGCL